MTNTYHPDPEINAGVAADRAEAEAFDVSIGYPPSRWTCDCGANHARGFFPIGSKSHRCLNCGYVGPGGTLAPVPEGSP